MSVLSDMSVRERNLWAELLVNVLVALYYFPKAFALFQKGNEAFSGAAMGGLVVKTIIFSIILAIIVAVISNVFLKNIDEPELCDERDRQFSSKALSLGNTVLIILLCIIISQIGLSVMFPFFNEHRGIELSPIIIAHLLLISLMLASTVKSCAQLFLYRRGY